MPTTLLKVRQNRNVFFKLPVDPKNKRKIFLPKSTMIELIRLFFGGSQG